MQQQSCELQCSDARCSAHAVSDCAQAGGYAAVAGCCNSKAVSCDALMQATVPRLRAVMLKLESMLLWLDA